MCAQGIDAVPLRRRMRRLFVAHVSHEAQLRAKQRNGADALGRVGRLRDFELLSIVAASASLK